MSANPARNRGNKPAATDSKANALAPLFTPPATSNTALKQHDFRQAVALAYEAGAFAPKVIAKGKALMADEIIRRAREAGIFVHESRDLVSLLMQVDLDQHIPPALYTAVAELLAWLYQLENKKQSFNQFINQKKQ